MSERVTPAEARAIAQRFVDRHFRNEGKEGPRISIPANPAYDDDLRLFAFIAQAEATERQRDEARDLYEKMMTAIHERACCRRDGAAGILGWIDDARAALTFHAKAQRLLFSGQRNVAARLRVLLEGP